MGCASGQGLLAQAHLAAEQAQGRASGQAGNAEHLRRARQLHGGAFKDYLREEGITPSDEVLELDFPTRANLPKGKLKTLALKDGYKDNQKLGFKRTQFPWLYEIPVQFQGKIKLPMWYSTCTRVSKRYPARTKGKNSTHDGSPSQGQAESDAVSRLSIGIASIWPCRITSCSAVGATCVWNGKADRFLCGRAGLVHAVHPGGGTECDNVRRYPQSRKTFCFELLTDYTDRFYKA